MDGLRQREFKNIQQNCFKNISLTEKSNLTNSFIIIIALFSLLIMQIIMVYIYFGVLAVNILTDQKNHIIINTLIMIFLMLPCLNISQINLRDSEINIHKSQANNIIPCLKIIGLGEGVIQSIETLLKSTCFLDILRCAANSPEKFQLDFADLVKFKIWRATSIHMSLEQSNFLKEQINPINFNYIENLYDHNDEENINEFLRLLKDCFNKVLMHLKLKDENGHSYGQYQLLNILLDQYSIYSDIKSNQNEYILPWMELRELNNFDLQDVPLKNSFNYSFYYQFSNFLSKFSNYSIIEDKILSNSQYQQISSNSVFLKVSTNKVQHNYNINYIWNLIESKLEIERERNPRLKDDISNFQSGDSKVNFYTRIVDDKQYSKIEDKINRKTNSIKINQLPQFQSLVKDQKRLSLIFNQEEDIMKFINKLRMMFGFKLDKEVYAENGTIKLKIREMKNGFNDLDDANMNLDQKDIKVIFEIVQLSSNLCISVECQCNILNLIKWKVADHLFQDFIRLEDNYKVTRTKVTQQEQYESNIRKILRFLQIIMIIYAIISTGVSQIGTQTYQIQNFGQISCVNNHYECQDQCYNLHELNDECRSFINNSPSTIFNENPIKMICSKFPFDQIIVDYCNFQFNYEEMINFSDGILNSDLICVYDDKQVTCMNNQNQTNNLRKNLQFKEILVHPDQQIYLNNLQILKSQEETSSLPTFLQDQFKRTNTIRTKTKQVKVSNNRICTLSFINELYCSEMLHSSSSSIILKAGNNHVCLSKFGNLQCWGGNIFNQAEVNKNWSTNITYLMAGSSNTCVDKDGKWVYCWGDNSFDQLKINAKMIKSPQLITSNSKVICAIQNDNLICYGQRTLIDEVKQGQKVQDVVLGESHICLRITLFDINCQGSNRQGQSDVPSSDIRLTIKQMSAYKDTTCYLNENSYLTCWGEVLEYSKYKEYVNVKLFNVGDLFCVLDINHELSCRSITSQNLKLQNVQTQVAGQDFQCVIDRNGQLFCNYISLIVNNKNLVLNLPMKDQEIDSYIGLDEIRKYEVIEFYLSSNDYVCIKTRVEKQEQIHCHFHNKLEQIDYSSHFCLTDIIQCNIDHQELLLECNYIENIFEKGLINGQNKKQYQKYEIILKEKVKKLSCNNDKLCILYKNGNAHCGHIENLNLNLLTDDMRYKVLKIYVNYQSTCILNKYRRIICDGAQKYQKNYNQEIEIPIPNQ